MLLGFRICSCAFSFLVVGFWFCNILQLWATVLWASIPKRNKPHTPPVSRHNNSHTHTHTLSSVSPGHHLQWTSLSGPEVCCRRHQRCSSELPISPGDTGNGGQSGRAIPACRWLLWAPSATSRNILMPSVFFFMTMPFFHDNALFVVHYYYILFCSYAEAYHDCVWFIAPVLSDLMVECQDGLCAIVCVCKWECTGLWFVDLFFVCLAHVCVS